MENKDTYNVKLLPCPHCGTDPVGIFGPFNTGYYIVECEFLDEDGEQVCGDWYYPGENKQEVAEAWNKRVF